MLAHRLFLSLTLLLVLAFAGRPAPAEDAVRPPALIFASEGAHALQWYDAQGKLAWSYPAEMCRDVWVLPNGNVLFCYNEQYSSGRQDSPSGVMEVTPDKKVVFQFRTTGQVWSCQRLANGQTLVANASQGKLLLVDAAGAVARTIALKNAPGHSCLRHARALPNGHFLVAEESAGMVREYDDAGRLVREIRVPFPPFSVARLASGETLISGRDGIVAVDAEDRVTWRVKASDLLELGVRWFAGFQVRPNGNLVVCNAGGKVPLFEITRETPARVVWKWPGALPLGHGICLADAPAR